MSVSKVSYTGDGSTDIFSIPFSYLHRGDVHVHIDGQKIEPIFFVAPNQVLLPLTPEPGSIILISRNTSRERFVDFINTSFLNADVLDLDSNQLMYLIQETLGVAEEALGTDPFDIEYFDAKGRGIKNLKDPVDPKDASNKEYVDDVKDAIDTELVDIRDAILAVKEYVDNLTEGTLDKVMQDIIDALESGELDLPLPDLTSYLHKNDLGVTVAKQQDMTIAQQAIDSLTTSLSNKVDKVTGKGLSSNDFTSAEKTKLGTIETGAQANKVHSVAGKTGNVVLNKNDVGLGAVQNYPVANVTQAEQGLSNLAYMTPLRVAQAIAKLASPSTPQNNAKIAIGSYTGSGSETRNINVGFRPGYVFILTRYGSGDSPTVSWIHGRNALMVIKNGGHRDLGSSYITGTANGFRVGGTKKSGTGAFMSLNATRVYHYIAIG